MQKTLVLFLLIPLFVLGQKFDGIVHYKDGNTKSGYITIADDNIVFRSSKKSKEKIKLDSKTIEKIDLIDRKKTLATFFLREIEKGNSTKTAIVIRLLNGNVGLYLHRSTGFNQNNVKVERFGYYIGRENEKLSKVYPTGITKTSDKNIKEYFQDCPKLGELIDNRAFEKIINNDPKLKRSEKTPKRLTEIVKYYNEKCAK